MLASGQVKARESVMEGLDQAPAAFMALLSGANFGKQIVKVAEEAA